jgi:WD40 repeat protein
VILGIFSTWSAADEPPSYAKQVRPIFAKYCLECHNTKSAKGGLDLETHKGMLEGSDNGPVIKVGKAVESVLILAVEGKGRNLMPPKSKTLRPTKDEIATLRAWIAGGAKDDSAAIKVAIPDIKPKKKTLPPVTALAYEPDRPILAVARDRRWQFIAADPKIEAEAIKAGSPAPITAMAVNGDRQLVIAAGSPGKTGIIHGLRMKRGLADDIDQQLATAHSDIILDLAFSPDGKTLATCSYDTQVKLWDVASGKLLHTLKDHSDAVYGVAFHPQGKMLATCAADRTVKVWDVASAKLLFTFSESTDWNYAVAWRPNGKQLAAAGVDKSIRVWDVNDQGGKIAHAVFAHEGPVTKLIYSADSGTLYSLGQDRVVKAWNAERMVEKKVYDRQSETVLSMALRPDGKQLALGRYDGQVVFIDTATGQATAATVTALANAPAAPTAVLEKPAKPEIKKITPSEGRRGQPIRIAIDGNHLENVGELVLPPGASGKILSKSPVKLEVEIAFPATTLASVQQISVKNGAGQSAPLSFIVDPFPAIAEREGNDSPGHAQPISVPVSVVGKLDKTGDIDFYRIDVKQGQQVGVQILTAAIGSKIEPALQIADLRGRVLVESNEGHLGHTFAEAGSYVIGVRDREFRGGANMHYRLHVGEIPVITAIFPLGVQRGAETDVHIEGVFLSSKSAKVKAPAEAAPGSKISVPITSSIGQPLGNANIVVGEFPEARWSPSASLPVPGAGDGVLTQAGQRDEWRFRAKKGRRLIVETQAQRIGSALDSVLEILDSNGQPVPRAVLRCQAKTFVTFRDHDNTSAGIRIDAWSDLAVNDYLYVGNELMKIKALPAHPDADCTFFNSAGGQRLAFLDTTPTHHSQNLPMYKVTIHPPGTTFPPNGFPVFTLNYRNDDGGPGYGRDSRIFFDPPADSEYRVRVSDARGQEGVNYGYRLTVRPPRPSFNVRFNPTAPVVWKEGAVPITISVDRLDGYDGPIVLRFDNLPSGFSIPRTEMQTGETTTAVAIYADAEATTPAKPQPLKLIAEALIDGQKQIKEAMGETPKATNAGEIVAFTDESEVAIRPGGTVKVPVHIERRQGFLGRVPLEVKGLPHGVHVLDIGLNGILITEKETRRTIVLYAEPWVQPTEHPFVVLARREGKNSEHAAKSVLLKVTK